MPLDNFTLRKYRVLKETPRGDQPGCIIAETADVGDIFIRAQIAEQVPDDTPLGYPKSGVYNRRDLVAKKP